MRKQTRPLSPKELLLNAHKWNESWGEKVASQPKPRFYWHRVGGISIRDLILPRLKKMTQGHCAYCDGFPLDTLTREPIDHFKPKFRFPLAAFDWGNLYYSCDLCNENKNDEWNEFLLRPDEPNYSFARYFICNYLDGELSPNPQGSDQERARAVETIRLFGLNTPERMRQRKIEMRKWQNEIDRRLLDEYAYRDFLEVA